MPRKWEWGRIAPAVIVIGWAAGAGAETLTLDEAVALALSNNRNLHSSALDARKAEDKLAAARTRQFPGISVYALGAQQLRSFEFTLERGILGTYAGTGPLPADNVSLKTPLAPTGLILARASQPLTSLIRIRRNMDTLKTGIQLANEVTRGERHKIVRDVKNVYYSLQQVEASLRSVRETSKLYEEVEKLTSTYVLNQVALKGDLLEARTRLAKAQQLETQLLNQQATGPAGSASSGAGGEGPAGEESGVHSGYRGRVQRRHVSQLGPLHADAEHERRRKPDLGALRLGP